MSCVPAFKAWPSSNTYSYFYLRRVSASYLLIGSYPTAWGRAELNLQCLPHGNGFTVRRNTANRCRFSEMRGHLTPYLCTRPRYAYSIRSALHHWNTRNRTRDSPDISRKLYHWAMFHQWQEVDLNHRSQGYEPCEITTSLPCNDRYEIRTRVTTVKGGVFTTRLTDQTGIYRLAPIFIVPCAALSGHCFYVFSLYQQYPWRYKGNRIADWAPCCIRVQEDGIEPSISGLVIVATLTRCLSPLLHTMQRETAWITYRD